MTYKVLTTALHKLISLQPLAVLAPHLLSLFLARQLSPHWKSQIVHLDLHHPVFGINFQVYFVSLTILVSIHLLIHLSTHLSRHPHSCHPSLLHSFTPGSKPTFSTNPFHLRLVYTYWTAFVTLVLDRTYHAHHFIFSFAFKFFCLFRVVD